MRYPDSCRPTRCLAYGPHYTLSFYPQLHPTPRLDPNHYILRRRPCLGGVRVCRSIRTKPCPRLSFNNSSYPSSDLTRHDAIRMICKPRVNLPSLQVDSSFTDNATEALRLRVGWARRNLIVSIAVNQQHGEIQVNSRASR